MESEFQHPLSFNTGLNFSFWLEPANVYFSKNFFVPMFMLLTGFITIPCECFCLKFNPEFVYYSSMILWYKIFMHHPDQKHSAKSVLIIGLHSREFQILISLVQL